FGPKQTWGAALQMSAFDPKRTYPLAFWLVTRLQQIPTRRCGDNYRHVRYLMPTVYTARTKLGAFHASLFWRSSCGDLCIRAHTTLSSSSLAAQGARLRAPAYSL